MVLILFCFLSWGDGFSRKYDFIAPIFSEIVASRLGLYVLFGRVASLILSFDTIKDTKVEFIDQIFHTSGYNVWLLNVAKVQPL